MKIGVGADHGGYLLKEQIATHLKSKGHEVVDYGTNSADSVDYPIYGEAVANGIIKGEIETGIVICGTGIGISLAANKVKGIRCALVSDTFSAKMAKEHNNCQMIAIGERVIGPGLALELIDAYLGASFGGDRHQRRVNLIMDIERR